MAEPLRVSDHSAKGWLPFKNEIGFVPDPMILRTGEIFFNGRTGCGGLGDADFTWKVLQQNIGALVEFVEFVATRDTLPLIGYGETFHEGTKAPLQTLLPDRTRAVHVDHALYTKVKKGALVSLAHITPDVLRRFNDVTREMDAFRYDWNPSLDSIQGLSAETQRRLEVLNTVAPVEARYLLGGLVFDGFAQASYTDHFIQPKRARFYASLTVVPDQNSDFSYASEDQIFSATETRLKDSRAEAEWTGTLPPVLPFLLEDGGEPTTVRDLLDRVLHFGKSARGQNFRSAVNAIRGGGSKGKLAEDEALAAQRQAKEVLAAYTTKAAPAEMGGLKIKLPTDLIGIPGGTVTWDKKLHVPAWFRIWWNLEVPFGGVQKTLRRMWMANDPYRDLVTRLRDLWLRS